MADPYTPDSPGAGNPIGCVATWLANLIRPPSPAYARAETKATSTAEPKGSEPVVARVRAVLVERTPVFQADGTPLDANAGPVAAITLVIDDDAEATTVLDAIQAGTPIRVLSTARC